MSHKKDVFTQSIPVITTLLRPYDMDKYTYTYETTNQLYIMINKYVSTLNKESGLSSKFGDKNSNRLKNSKSDSEKKTIQDMLFKLQIKCDSLYNEVINIIRGKKGNIRTLFGGRCNFTTRNVIIADPTLRIDEIRLPYSSLHELLQHSICNILTKTYNLSYDAAYKRWYYAGLHKDPVIVSIIESIIHNSLPNHRGLPVLINRNPTINYGSIFAMHCVGISDPGEKFEYVMQVPLQILVPLQADFDGDVLNAMYVINRAFWELADNIFNPKNAFYLSRNDGLFNNAVNFQKDTLINANSLSMLGYKCYNNDDIVNAERIVSKWA
jgi:hypothetical protein